MLMFNFKIINGSRVGLPLGINERIQKSINLSSKRNETFKHEFCRCGDSYCYPCQAGLSYCVVCGGGEGSLLSFCPGEYLAGVLDEIYNDGSLKELVFHWMEMKKRERNKKKFNYV